MKDKLEQYLNKYLTPQKEMFSFFKMKENKGVPPYDYCFENINRFIDENKEEETFQTKLFQLIDQKQLKDSDVYNKVDIDRRLFSKIRSNKDYHPSKETILLLGIALELEEKEIEELLSLASYSLPMNTTFDLIIRFCFKEHIYNLNQINEFLYDYNCKILNT